jgi:hypothetical protein
VTKMGGGGGWEGNSGARQRTSRRKGSEPRLLGCGTYHGKDLVQLLKGFEISTHQKRFLITWWSSRSLLPNGAVLLSSSHQSHLRDPTVFRVFVCFLFSSTCRAALVGNVFEYIIPLLTAPSPEKRIGTECERGGRHWPHGVGQLTLYPDSHPGYS